MNGFARHIAPSSFKEKWGSTLKSIGTRRDLCRARRAHGEIVRTGFEHDGFVANNMLQAYGKCGAVGDARRVFDSIAAPDAFSFTMMLVAYSENGHLLCARNLYESVGDPSIVLSNALLAAYVKSGKIVQATGLFGEIVAKDAASWNTMIAAYAQVGHTAQAIAAFRGMDLDGVAPSAISFVAALDACSSAEEVRSIHSRLQEAAPSEISQPKVGNALLAALGRLSLVESAEAIFAEMRHRGTSNVVSWTALASAYVRSGDPAKAVRTFRDMNLEGERPNEITLAIVLQSVASAGGGIREWNAIVELAAASLAPSSLLVANAVVSAYAKLGLLDRARDFFRAMPRRDAVSFNAAIAASAQGGRALEALLLARDMRVEGLQPTAASFASILGACAHAGMLRDAWIEFRAMVADFAIAPGADHFACMADLLGRGGRVPDAEELLCSMPFEPDYVAWTGLMDACRGIGDRERRDAAAQRMRDLEPEKSSPYILALF